MATAGPNLPTVGTTDASLGLLAWANADRITAGDGESASAAGMPTGSPTVLLIGKGFGFAIPPDATIDGITVEIVRSSIGSRCGDVLVSLLSDGLVDGDNRADFTTVWPATAAAKAYGGPTDLWGLALTPADVNDPEFGVGVQCVKAIAGPGGARVDYLSVTVHYH